MRPAERRPSRPLRCLHVFATFVAAGPQVRSVALWNALGTRFDHAVVALDHRLDALALAGTTPIAVVAAPPRGGSLRTAWRMRRVLACQRPDALFTYGFAALDAIVAARSLGLRAIVHHEDGFAADEAFALLRRRVAYRRLALPLCHRVVVVSAGLEELATTRFGVRRNRLRRIDNGVDGAAHRAPRDPRTRASVDLSADDLVVGTVSHLRAVKRLDRLLSAVARARAPWRVLIVGAGAEEAALRAQSERPELRGRVRFAGDQRRPHPWLAALDVFALTSDSEQMPLSVLEAMASGLPLVATAVGEVPRMLPREQAARLVDPLAPDVETQLAQRLDQLADDVVLRAALGASNRRHVEERYSLATMVEHYRALYDELSTMAP